MIAKAVGRVECLCKAVHTFEPVATAFHPDVECAYADVKLLVYVAALRFADVGKLNVLCNAIVAARHGNQIKAF